MIERIPITSREQWLNLRRADISASQVGALFGLHPYLTAFGLNAEKSGVEMVGPDSEASVIRRGNALEQVVADEVKRQRPEWDIAKATFYVRDTEARIGATPDFIVNSGGRRGILQVKTVGSSKFRREWRNGSDEIAPPFWITLQNATECMLDAEFGAIAALVIGEYQFDTHVILIERRRSAEDRIRRAVSAFWQAHDAGVEPEADYGRDGDLIDLLYPEATPGKIVDLRANNKISSLLERHELEATLLKEAEARKDAVDAEIRHLMGDAEFAIVDGWRLSNKTIKQKESIRPATQFRRLRASRGEPRKR
jgi:predicted phage-related endonuclease